MRTECSLGRVGREELCERPGLSVGDLSSSEDDSSSGSEVG